MGRFLLGFVIGAAIGAAAVVISAPRSGTATRQGIRNLVNDTLDVARQASATREQQLWDEYHTRIISAKSGAESQNSE
ncbi:MAG: YtxH domain-containing protein [Kouleothrix sp.]|nr:YtxH domain-containing protein [Kouleothrix sp.]